LETERALRGPRVWSMALLVRHQSLEKFKA